MNSTLITPSFPSAKKKRITRKRTKDLNILDTSDIPNFVSEAIRRGNTFVPFIYLTTDFVRSTEAMNVSFTGGSLNHPKIKPADEHKLTIEEWESASLRWINALEMHWGAELANEWRDHYRHYYWGGRLNAENWLVNLEYDILLRGVVLPKSALLPIMNAPALVTKAEEAAYRRNHDKWQAKISEHEAMISDLKHQLGQFQNQSFRQSTRSFANTQETSQNTSRPSLPTQPQSFRKFTNTSNSRPQQPVKGSQDSRFFCFACGSSLHTASRCNESRTINGHDIYAHRGERGNWTLPNGDRLCYPFNLSTGCQSSQSSCSRGAHVCARCGTSTHGSFYCSS